MTELRSFLRPPTEPLVFRTGTHVYTPEEMRPVTTIQTTPISPGPGLRRPLPVGGPPANATLDSSKLVARYRLKKGLTREDLASITPEVVAVWLQQVEDARSTMKRVGRPALVGAAAGLPVFLLAGVATGAIKLSDKQDDTPKWAWTATIVASLIAGATIGGFTWYASRPPVKLLTYVKQHRPNVIAEGLRIHDARDGIVV